MIRIFCLSILLLLLTACTVDSNPGLPPTMTRSPVPTTQSTSTSTPSVTADATASQEKPTTSPSAEISATSPTSTVTEVLANIEYICPEERLVPLASLGLSAEDRIIVEDIDNSTGGFFMLGGTDTEPIPIPNTAPEPGYHNEFERASPDGRWFLYYKVLNGTFDATLWISSFDGEQQWQIMPIDTRAPAGWVSNEEIVGVSRPGDRENYTPILLLNPFTQEINSLSPIPASGRGLNWWNSDDINYEIYFDNFYILPSGEHAGRFAIYNYNTDETHLAFQWLNAETDYLRDHFYLYYMFRIFDTPEGLISLILVRPYGFDIAANLDIDTIITASDYEEIMQPVILPGDNPDMRITWIARTNPSFAFDRLDYRQYEPRSTQFYVFNYQNMSLIDYCYDRGYTDIISYGSPDDRYLAWNTYEVESNDIVGVNVIDFETGRVSYLDGVEVIGWGIVQR